MKMSEVEVRKSGKRPSKRQDQNSGQHGGSGEPSDEFEQLEAKRRRSYTEFYNRDTGVTGYFTVSGFTYSDICVLLGKTLASLPL